MRRILSDEFAPSVCRTFDRAALRMEKLASDIGFYRRSIERHESLGDPEGRVYDLQTMLVEAECNRVGVLRDLGAVMASHKLTGGDQVVARGRTFGIALMDDGLPYGGLAPIAVDLGETMPDDGADDVFGLGVSALEFAANH